MRTVFLETTWVVKALSPRQLAMPAATNLLEAARAGDIAIMIPGVAVAEGVKKIPEVVRRQLRELTTAFEVIRFALDAGEIQARDAKLFRDVLTRFRNKADADLGRLRVAAAQLRATTGVSVFNLDDEMLEYCFVLRDRGLRLHPFDEAILAGVLRKAASISGTVEFRTLDADFSPGEGEPRATILRQEYEKAEVAFFLGFDL